MKPGEGLKSPGARRELRTQNGDPENPLFKGQVERVQSADKEQVARRAAAKPGLVAGAKGSVSGTGDWPPSLPGPGRRERELFTELSNMEVSGDCVGQNYSYSYQMLAIKKKLYVLILREKCWFVVLLIYAFIG